MRARALVVGAQGVHGSFIVHELREHGWDVLRAGRRAEPAEDFRCIDLNAPITSGAIPDDARLIISTVPHGDLLLEQHVLEKGGILLSPACVPRLALHKLNLYQGKAKGVVVPHAGLTPGLSNLLAADLLKNATEVINLAIGLTFRALSASGAEGRKWVFGLLAKSAVTPVTQVRLPSPLNVRRYMSTDLAAEGWLSDPDRPPSQRLEFCFIERILDALLRGLSSLRWVSLFSRIAAPGYLHRTPKPTQEPIFQWATARAADGRESGWLVSAHGDYRSTAAAVRIFAEAVMRLNAESRLPRGLVRLQDVLTLGDVKPQFSASRISVSAWNGSYEACSAPPSP